MRAASRMGLRAAGVLLPEEIGEDEGLQLDHVEVAAWREPCRVL